MQLDGKFLLIALLIVVAIIILVYVRRKFKVLSLPCVFFVSGAVKSGKTLLSVHLAIKEYKKALRHWYIRKWLVKIFLPFKYKEIYGLYDEYVSNDYRFTEVMKDNLDNGGFPPMLYSNIPLAMVKYNRLTIDIVEQKKRIPCKSVILIDEISLFADSQLFKEKDLNNKLMRFFKLYGHYSHGGKLIIDSQAIADNHFSLRRCMSSYLYIQERKKLPFVSVLYVREMIYSEDKSALNVVDEDLSLSLRKVLIWNTTYNKYDCYCYSVFTDYLPYEVQYDVDIASKKDNLKCSNIITLNEFVMEMNQGYKKHFNIDLYDSVSVDDEGVVHRKEDDNNEIA